MLDPLANLMRRQAGITDEADLGTIFRESRGTVTTEILMGIEKWRELYFMRVTSRLSRGATLCRTRVVKWPFSRDSARDLAGVLRDFEALENPETSGRLSDHRSAFGRLLDRLIRRHVLGSRNFLSPVENPGRITIRAEVYRAGGEMSVTLAELRPGSGSILARMRHAALPAVRAALETFARTG